MTTVNESINHCAIAIRKQINCVTTSYPCHLQVASSKSDKSFKGNFAGSVCSIAAAVTQARVYTEARSEPVTARSVQQARKSSGGPATRCPCRSSRCECGSDRHGSPPRLDPPGPLQPGCREQGRQHNGAIDLSFFSPLFLSTRYFLIHSRPFTAEMIVACPSG